ncbi:MAG: hypothetical protein BGP06_01640 [Rhizobiales bacterium 65-9]|nr:hypothetical protein [Hyphomicrobiales bacterium]OJY37657.1 MAG: hypothetical protein BGP06_01640 [Rhizobiales bacterium 65-9]
MQTIPIFDARAVGVVGHLAAEREAALALRREAVGWLPPWVRPLAPAVEAANRWWLRRNRSPYRDEIFEMARILGEPGLVSINVSYEWGCTTLGVSPDGGRPPLLLRTLDWPFPGLGRGVQVVRMEGRAGEYWNVAWPGAAGVLTAMAPGRFAAALNQAPMRRRASGEWSRVADFALNGARAFFGVRAMPGMHLLRLAFEKAKDVPEAVDLLARTPIARPCIFTLVGCAEGEIVVIEKTETAARVLQQPGATANAFRPGFHAGLWEARPCACSFADAPANNLARGRLLDELAARSSAPFDWLLPPVLNGFTRLAVEAAPAAGLLRVRGYEPEPAGGVRQATRDFDLSDALLA